MSRAKRLLDLLQILRRHRQPVTGRMLARELGISIRSFYRDISTLQAQGANIEGEAGIGYILRPGFTLPPLMFSEDEIEALVLGSRWVVDRADTRLSKAARNALAKISAVVPDHLRDELEASSLLVGPGETMPETTIDVGIIRKAIRAEKKLVISYDDSKGKITSRAIWPFALGYFDRVRVIIAWCELRDGFRHFRTDRVTEVEPVETRYPRRRPALLKEWRAQQGISPPRD